jgi:hypothetical protein
MQYSMRRQLFALLLTTALLTFAISAVAGAQTPQSTPATSSNGHGVANHPAVVESRLGSVTFGGSPLKPIAVLAFTLAGAAYVMRSVGRGFDSLLDG